MADKGPKARTMYAAAWLDNYDQNFGVYKAFRRRSDCLDYLVDTVFERAHWLCVKVRPADDGCRPRTLSRAEVRRRLDKHGEFALSLGDSWEAQCDGDRVTVGIREMEVE